MQAREDWWKGETARITEEAQQQVQKVLSDNEDSRKESQQQVIDVTAQVEEQRKTFEVRIDGLTLQIQQLENSLMEKETLLAAQAEFMIQNRAMKRSSYFSVAPTITKRQSRQLMRQYNIL